MRIFLGLALFTLALLSYPNISYANNGMKVSRVKCDGGWIRQGSNKLEVLDACGQPLMSETVSGANDRKMEGLFYKIDGKKYILFLDGGEVRELQLQRR